MLVNLWINWNYNKLKIISNTIGLKHKNIDLSKEIQVHNTSAINLLFDLFPIIYNRPTVHCLAQTSSTQVGEAKTQS